MLLKTAAKKHQVLGSECLKNRKARINATKFALAKTFAPFNEETYKGNTVTTT